MMLHEMTRRQLALLKINRTRPLVICDVDEVIVHFTRDFEAYLEPKDLLLDIEDLQRLNGTVKRRDSGAAVDDETTFRLVNDFFSERTRDMLAIEGAVEGLSELARYAEVVMLTNLPHEAGDDRRHNLSQLGLPFPVITNSGPKGHAIRQIVDGIAAPVVFIDDSISFITSAYEHAPHVHLVHFLHDPRFHRNDAPLDFVSLRTDHWRHVTPHVLRLLQAGERAIEPRAAAV